MENVIEVRDVNKFFGEEHVLKNVSHTFEKGKIHGIVGNNGSGKTVLMKCICGFLRPNSGAIFVNHKQVGRRPISQRILVSSLRHRDSCPTCPDFRI